MGCASTPTPQGKLSQRPRKWTLKVDFRLLITVFDTRKDLLLHWCQWLWLVLLRVGFRHLGRSRRGDTRG